MLKIGIDLGGTNIAAGIVNENGEILHKSSVPTGASRPKEEIIDDYYDYLFDIWFEEDVSDVELYKG